MKKILLWSVIPPFNDCTAKEILTRNLIGSNTGNLLFHHSVVRALMTDADTEFETQFSSVARNLDEAAARANETCSCFAIPLANAFRKDYIPKLEVLTQFIQRLKIPCVVIGVGVQTAAADKLKEGLLFDGQVRDFVRAVLDRSSLIGVRGEYTADYLKRLGFSEERHFSQIGCPSMYMFGGDLPETRALRLDAEASVCVNGKIDSGAEIHGFMARSCQEFPNYWYIPQRIEEIWMMYAGMPIPRRHRWNIPEYLPTDFGNRVLRERRSAAFLNVSAWLDFMRDKDLSYGCNIHGNIAATLAGVPAVVVARDLRVAELANFFQIPMISLEEIRSGIGIREACERADFSGIAANHPKRFARFVDFLDRNGLEHIYGNGGSVQNAPYDLRLQQIAQAPAIYPRTPLSPAQRVDCLPVYWAAVKHYRVRYIRKRNARRGSGRR